MYSHSEKFLPDSVTSIPCLQGALGRASAACMAPSLGQITIAGSSCVLTTIHIIRWGQCITQCNVFLIRVVKQVEPGDRTAPRLFPMHIRIAKQGDGCVRYVRGERPGTRLPLGPCPHCPCTRLSQTPVRVLG